MTKLSKTKSYPKPIVDFESNLEIVKINKRFYPKNYPNENHTNNQQVCIDWVKPRSNKNKRECKKCGCDYFYVPNC